MGFGVLARIGAGVNEFAMHAERIDGYNPLAVADAVGRGLIQRRGGGGDPIEVFVDEMNKLARALGMRVRGFLPTLGPEVRWIDVPAEDSETVEQLLGLVERDAPDGV